MSPLTGGLQTCKIYERETERVGESFDNLWRAAWVVMQLSKSLQYQKFLKGHYSFEQQKHKELFH